MVGPRDTLLTELLYDGLVVAALVAVLIMIATTGRGKSPALVVRPDVPSFDSPLNATGTALALAFTLMAGGQVGSLFDRNRPPDLRIDNVVLTVLFALVAALHLIGAWHGLRVRLEPDGLRWRTPARSVVVPWAAPAPGGPPRPKLSDTALRLAYAHPELVRRRGPGWRLDRLPVGQVHPWFLQRRHPALRGPPGAPGRDRHRRGVPPPAGRARRQTSHRRAGPRRPVTGQPGGRSTTIVRP